MIGAVAGALMKGVVGGLFGDALSTIKEIMGRRSDEKITKIEADAAVAKVLAETQASVEAATVEAATKMFGEFQTTVRSSPIVARAYVAILVSQAFVLLWYQVGAEAFRLVTGTTWAIPDDAATMAVGLVTLCLGGGPFVFKKGVDLSAIFRRGA